MEDNLAMFAEKPGGFEMFRPAFRLVSAVFALCALCAVPAAAMLTATDEQALLHFTVLGPDGKPLAGANVSLEGNDPAHNFSGNTDDAGQVDLLAAVEPLSRLSTVLPICMSIAPKGTSRALAAICVSAVRLPCPMSISDVLTANPPSVLLMVT